jgi:hypothetical protein
MLNSFAAWAGLLGTMVAFAALAMSLVAAGSGHLGWAMVGGAVLLGSLGVGLGTVAAVVHYDHRHDKGTPHLF